MPQPCHSTWGACTGLLCGAGGELAPRTIRARYAYHSPELLVVYYTLVLIPLPIANLGPTQANVRRPACLENPAGERALPAYYYRSAMLLPTQTVTPPQGLGMPWLTKPSP